MCQFCKTRLPWLHSNHKQTSCARYLPSLELHYKSHRTKKPTEFPSPSPTIHKTLQSEVWFSKTVKFSAIIPKLNTYFLYNHALISFKRDENIGNFLVRSAFKSGNQPGTFKCKRTQCKTCPFISTPVNISGPNRTAKSSDHFICISINVIHCITCTLCKKIYLGEIARKLADRFREHLRDVEKTTRPNQLHAI